MFDRLIAVSVLVVVFASSPARAEVFKPVRTAVIRGGQPAQPLVANVTGLTDLYLVATIGPDTYNYDQAIWAAPTLYDRAGRAVDMTTLKPASAVVGWGAFHANQAHGGAALSIAGKPVGRGFYAHAPSVLHFELGGNYTRFEAAVGIATASGRNGSCEFEVTNVAPKASAAPAAKAKAVYAAVTSPLSPAARSPHQFNAQAAKLLLDQGIDKLVFVRRFTLTCSHVYTEHVDARWTPGGGLCVLDLKDGSVVDLTPSLSSGVVNRFDVSYDGKRIVFDYKKGPQDGYRIYEVYADGTGLRQLTFPEPEDEDLVRRYRYGTNDMHPCYLPGGDIVFTSTRCKAAVLCDSSSNFTSTVLHRMDADGRHIRPLSHNTLSEFSPAVLPDGRLLYMRWEYNRKGAGAVKCLWSMLPDGSASAEVYGNDIVDPETMLYGRPIPGASDKISFLGCSHWGPNNGVGTVIVLDTRKDARSAEAMTRVTREVDARTHGGYTFCVDGQWVNDSTGTLGRLFKDPYPLSERQFLVAQKPKGLYWHDPKGYELALLDERGEGATLYRDEEISCWHPYPLRRRELPPSPTPAPKRELDQKDVAQCVLADVYAGLVAVPRGSVKYIRILEQTPRPWAARTRWAGDTQGMAHSALGPHLLGMQAQHGVVPVEPDGSANFYVPANRNVYFQVLDADYRAIQTERTYVNYQAGETRSCVGCHDRGRPPAAAVGAFSQAAALKRAPSVPAPQPGDAAARKLFDYERQIQPIWDKHCVACHDGTPTAKGGSLDLTGKLTALHNVSYENLLRIGVAKARAAADPLVGVQVDENDVRAFVEYTPPYYFGAYSSLLAATIAPFEPRFDHLGPVVADRLKQRVALLREQHMDVRVSREEQIRITNWLDASCQYYPSYWGQKNLQHHTSPYFRPEVSFEQALGPNWPSWMNDIYEPRK